VNGSCPICGHAVPIDSAFCPRAGCVAASERRDRDYKNLPMKSLRKRHGISVPKMNDAIQMLAAAHAERLVPATMRPLPPRAQAKVDTHERRQCDCAEQERIYTHENWHLLEGAQCNCADIDWLEASEESCKSTVTKIKMETRNRMAPIYVPVLDEFATKLYSDYANRNLEMTDGLKIRLETIEDIAISFLLHLPYCPEIVKPLDESKSLGPIEDDENRDRALVLVEHESEIGRPKAKGKTSGGNRKAISSFDQAVREHKETRETEALTQDWIREYLAQNRAAGKSRQGVEAELDSLFGVKTPAENPKSGV
jgi:hypothetical protein